MNRDEVDLAETRYVRARVLDALRRSGYQVVMEGLVAHDGWRAEFLGQQGGADVVLMTHKPFEAPFLGVSTSLDLVTFDRADDLAELLDLVSDHDLSPFFADAERDLLQLSSRLPIAGVNEADLEFWVGNLLACRQLLLERFGPRAE